MCCMSCEIKLMHRWSLEKVSQHPEDDSFVYKLQRGQDKFMTTTFKSVAILGEGCSGTKAV